MNTTATMTATEAKRDARVADRAVAPAAAAAPAAENPDREVLE